MEKKYMPLQLCTKHNIGQNVKCLKCNTLLCAICFVEHSETCGLKLSGEVLKLEKDFTKKICNENILKLKNVIKGFKEQRESLISVLSSITTSLAIQEAQKEIEILKKEIYKIQQKEEGWHMSIQHTVISLGWSIMRATQILNDLEAFLNHDSSQDTWEIMNKKISCSNFLEEITILEKSLSEYTTETKKQLNNSQVFCELDGKKTSLLGQQIYKLNKMKVKIQEKKDTLAFYCTQILKQQNELKLLQEEGLKHKAQISQSLKYLNEITKESNPICYVCNKVLQHKNCKTCSKLVCTQCCINCLYCEKALCNTCARNCTSCGSYCCQDCLASHLFYCENFLLLPRDTKYIYTANYSKDRIKLWRFNTVTSKIENTEVSIPIYGRVLQINKRIFLTGGYDSIANKTVNTTSEFMECSNQLVSLSNMIYARYEHCMLSIDANHFCVVGGYQNGCEQYHIKENKWTLIPSLNNNLHWHGSIRTVDKILQNWATFPQMSKFFGQMLIISELQFSDGEQLLKKSGSEKQIQKVIDKNYQNINQENNIQVFTYYF